ncbi:hypothetical protein THAOC_20671 [Thalassiosira oceanica]|uniref:Smr domain-containing protein n=1 Tax=Thalassiosira oceanica TaxID=159749 RepID=K0SL23_THAOC|nr:hypothetical protein THAOC_20671 [Thalassiosira oceanica]|eukprot:EJK59142.1 hypothetical protein THAOC_20671 [Thalassiosira oceanica]
MVRSKTNRRHRPSPSFSSKVKCPGEGSSISISDPASLGHRNRADVQNSIDYHWSILGSAAKTFIVGKDPERPEQMSLRKLVDFWSQPQRIGSARDSCAYSLSGSSWYLSLQYLYLGSEHLAVARALILHGSFMRECVETPIETIIELCRDDDSKAIDFHLPIYASGFRACKSKESMFALLERVMPIDYRRRMAFASQKNKSVTSNYCESVSAEWCETTPSAAARKMRIKGSTREMLQIVFKNSIGDCLAISICKEDVMKTAFTRYSEETGGNLRLLRFRHRDRQLFLSSAANKTAEQLGLSHLDTIDVSSSTATELPAQVPSCVASRKSSNKKKTKSPGKTLPRTRRQRTNVAPLSIEPAVCPSASYIVGGKAGKKYFEVRVGEQSSLYTTSRRSPPSRRTLVDLHGMSKTRALNRLDEGLPLWVEDAMEEYPFVGTVRIVTGGGNQILADAVRGWIARNKQVANAPQSS